MIVTHFQGIARPFQFSDVIFVEFFQKFFSLFFMSYYPPPSGGEKLSTIS